MTSHTKDKRDYEDFKKLPEGTLCQLIEGKLIMTPSPSYDHQKIVTKLGTRLFQFVVEQKAGEVLFSPMDVYFSDSNVFQPDILFFGQGGPSLNEERKIIAPPDLVIEVLSPSTAYYDLRIKKEAYEESGVQEYWIVDPLQKSLEVYENTDGGFQIFSRVREEGQGISKLLSGFEVDCEWLFEE